MNMWGASSKMYLIADLSDDGRISETFMGRMSKLSFSFSRLALEMFCMSLKLVTCFLLIQSVICFAVNLGSPMERTLVSSWSWDMSSKHGFLFILPSVAEFGSARKGFVIVCCFSEMFFGTLGFFFLGV